MKREDLRAYEKTKRTDKYFLMRFLLWAGISFCGLVLYGLVGGVTNEPSAGFLTLFLFVLVAGAVLRKQENTRLSRLANEIIPYELIVDRLGVTQKVGRTETKYVWSEIENVERAAGMIEIKTWDGHTYLVPKHSFENDAAFDLAFEFMSEMQKAIISGHG